jgi:hypothetical protein
LYQSHIRALKVSSGEESLKMLLQSERIKQDLEIALQQDEPKMDVIVREWVEIPISMEFRGFCFNRKLNGISQYFDMLYFQELNDNSDKILQEILSFYDSISSKIPLDNYIIDFGISTNGKIFIIELNPWNTNTGFVSFLIKRRCNVQLVPRYGKIKERSNFI